MHRQYTTSVWYARDLGHSWEPGDFPLSALTVLVTQQQFMLLAILGLYTKEGAKMEV